MAPVAPAPEFPRSFATADLSDAEVAEIASARMDFRRDHLNALLAGKPKRRRYTIGELLHGATPETMRQLHKQTAWAREGDPVGREH